MITRQNERFRAVAQVAEERCHSAGLAVDADEIDLRIRRWIAHVAEALGVSDEIALDSAPPDLGRLIANNLIGADRRHPRSPHRRGAAARARAHRGS
ncbi:MAG TPA: hypothetical protein VK020_06095 [Microlunatus sp.]|nr:hypothetical protein [Microlunatus sp.]